MAAEDTPETNSRHSAEHAESHTGVDRMEPGGWVGRDRGNGGEEVLTVIWTCPDWEVDWISEILEGAGIEFRMVFDKSLQHMASNALIALSQNDERNRPPDLLARYLLRFRRRGYRVGVLHMSDEDYSAPTYFYPWVDYVLRNHYQQHLALLPHVLAIPLGYKKGFWASGGGAGGGGTQLNLVQQVARERMSGILWGRLTTNPLARQCCLQLKVSRDLDTKN